MTAIESPVYLDSNILIYAMETDEDEGLLARRWLMQIDRGRIAAVVSALTVVEVLPHPIAKSDAKLVDGYRRLLTAIPSLEVVSISPAILFRAAELRAELNSETPDAIHIATAIELGCRGFLTNDRRLKVPPGLRRYELADVSAFYK